MEALGLGVLDFEVSICVLVLRRVAVALRTPCVVTKYLP